MGVGSGLYIYDVVVKRSRSLSHLLMSSCLYRVPSLQLESMYVYMYVCMRAFVTRRCYECAPVEQTEKMTVSLARWKTINCSVTLTSHIHLTIVNSIQSLCLSSLPVSYSKYFIQC